MSGPDELPFDQLTFAPINDAARVEGQRRLVRKGEWYAAAVWIGGTWAYPPEIGGGPLPFEPTHYEVKP